MKGALAPEEKADSSWPGDWLFPLAPGKKILHNQ
jgi:hypothetical protein